MLIQCRTNLPISHFRILLLLLSIVHLEPSIRQEAIVVSWIVFRAERSGPRRRMSRDSSAFSTHEAPDALCNFICRGIEREMAPVDNMYFGLGHIAAISFRLRGVE